MARHRIFALLFVAIVNLCGCIDDKALDGWAPNPASNVSTVSDQLSREMEESFNLHAKCMASMTTELLRVKDAESARAVIPAISALLIEELELSNRYDDVVRRAKQAVNDGKMDREMGGSVVEASERYAQKRAVFFAQVDQVPLEFRRVVVQGLSAELVQKLFGGDPNGVVLGIPIASLAKR